MPVRKFGVVAAIAVAIAGSILSSAAYAKGAHHYHGHHHGGNWGWGGFGLGVGTGLLVGSAPYWGGYGAYGYAGDCYLTRRWVINRYGYRVLRTVEVC